MKINRLILICFIFLIIVLMVLILRILSINEKAKSDALLEIPNSVKTYSAEEGYSAICMNKELSTYFYTSLDQLNSNGNFTKVTTDLLKISNENEFPNLSESIVENLDLSQIKSNFDLNMISPDTFYKGENYFVNMTFFYKQLYHGFVMINSMGNKSFDDKLLDVLKQDNNCPIIYKSNRNISHIDNITFSKKSKLDIFKTSGSMNYYFWDENKLYETVVIFQKNSIIDNWKVIPQKPNLLMDASEELKFNSKDLIMNRVISQ